jgi:hypothetical protein
LLKLSFEQLALIVVLVGLPRRRLDAGKQRGLQAGVLAVEAVLTEQGQVANALGVAAVEGLRRLVMRRATLGMSVSDSSWWWWLASRMPVRTT